MITDDLNGLLKEYDFKKDVLDNHTTEITKGIREWCLNENKRIDEEYRSLAAFFSTNIRKFLGICYVKNGAYRWSGLALTYLTDGNGHITEISSVGLDNEYKYKKHLGVNWTNLPKVDREYHFYNGKLDVNNTDLDYWMNYKRMMAIRNEELNEVAKLTKDLLNTMILNEKNRCEEMVGAVKDIEKDEKSEIVIVVR